MSNLTVGELECENFPLTLYINSQTAYGLFSLCYFKVD